MSAAEIFEKVANKEITPEEAQKLLAKSKVSLKVAEKSGALQFDGIRRFPITLYLSEWEILDGMRDEINKFIIANKSRLSKKKGE
jgi:hypothetical protein